VGGKYSFPDIRILDKLTNPAITAYYIPGMNGIERVYVYQGDKYICECAKVVQFQEAVAEQTEADLTNMDNQRAYQQSFNQLIRAKKKAVVKLGTIKDDKVAQPTAKRTIVMPEPVAEEYEMPLAIENWRAAAARSL